MRRGISTPAGKEIALKKRGRPKKEDKDQIIQMRRYLEKGNCGFDVIFGKNRKLEHSPVLGRKENKQKEKDERIDEVNGQKEATEVADSTAGTNAKEENLPTERDEERRDKKEAAVGEASGNIIEKMTEGDTGSTPDTAREEAAIELREMSREIKILKEMREEDRSRLEKLDEEIERVKEDKIVTTAVENTERNVNNAVENKIRDENGNEGEVYQDGEVVEEEIDDRQEEEGNYDRNNNLRIEDRKYLKVIPDKLGEEELKWEMAERKSRKKSIVIRAIRTTGAKLKKEIKGIMKE
ncbi:hypothetical protein TSAR_007950, partial [Trichomalopsis sarcophagae]